jgi:anti-sigma regulatory factor (Ser/Thr protein kinase)
MASLTPILAYTRHCIAEAALREPVAGRIELVLEELFSNTVMHGYGRECDESAWLRIERRDRTMLVEYSDAAPPYDPMQHRVDLDLDKEDRPEGGLGILIARRLADRMDYRYAAGRNVLIMEFDIPA